jgi:hypothetical protein
MPVRIRGDYLSKFSLSLTFIRLGNNVQVSSNAAFCPRCGYQFRAILLREKEEASPRLEMAMDKFSYWEKKTQRWFDFLLGGSEKMVVGAYLIGMFQNNESACWVALAYLIFAAILICQAPE